MDRSRMWSPASEEKLTLKLEGMAYVGDAFGRHEGQVVFAAGGIPGEDVEVEVLSRRRDYVAGRVSRVLNASESRVPPKCQYFGKCGGCQWQHIEYGAQVKLKSEIVREQFRRLGKFREADAADTVQCPEPWGYRNHLRFTVNREGLLCYVSRGRRARIPVDECLIGHIGINRILGQLQGKCRETRALSVRYGAATGQWLIQPKLDSPDIKIESGQAFYEEVLAGRVFRVSAASFFQVNTFLNGSLAGLVLDKAGNGAGKVLVDAYAGVGTFALLASTSWKKVLAIEESPAAAQDAMVNLRGAANVQYIRGSTQQVMGELKERPDAVILDPPRCGCAEEVIVTLGKLRVPRIVYVSCDPATQARDARRLVDAGYELMELQPVDLFPQTYHVECIAVFETAEGSM